MKQELTFRKTEAGVWKSNDGRFSIVTDRMVRAGLRKSFYSDVYILKDHDGRSVGRYNLLQDAKAMARQLSK